MQGFMHKIFKGGEPMCRRIWEQCAVFKLRMIWDVLSQGICLKLRLRTD